MRRGDGLLTRDTIDCNGLIIQLVKSLQILLYNIVTLGYVLWRNYETANYTFASKRF